MILDTYTVAGVVTRLTRTEDVSGENGYTEVKVILNEDVVIIPNDGNRVGTSITETTGRYLIFGMYDNEDRTELPDGIPETNERVLIQFYWVSDSRWTQYRLVRKQ